MRLSKDCGDYGLRPDGPYANPFHPVETLDMANMRGVQVGGVGHTIDLVRGHAHLAASNLVDRGLEVGHRIVRALVGEVTSLILPEQAQLRSGIFETTGSHSNEKALRLAKRATGRKKIVCSSLTHGSITEAAQDLEMPLTVIPVDPETMQMDEQALLEALDDETAVLVLTAGSTHLGNVESLPDSVEDKLKVLGVRLHVDAAYGGLNIGLQDPASSQKVAFDRLAGSSAVSSMTVDVHKFAGPMGCSVLILNESEANQEESYLEGASWLSGSTQGSLVPYLSLRALQRLGPDRLREYAHRNVASAQVLEKALAQLGVSTIMPVSSGVIPILTGSMEEAQFLHDALAHVGFGVPKPVQIATTEGPLYGVRIVFTPDVFYDYLYLTEELAPMIADVLRRSRFLERVA